MLIYTKFQNRGGDNSKAAGTKKWKSESKSEIDYNKGEMVGGGANNAPASSGPAKSARLNSSPYENVACRVREQTSGLKRAARVSQTPIFPMRSWGWWHIKRPRARELASHRLKHPDDYHGPSENRLDLNRLLHHLSIRPRNFVTTSKFIFLHISLVCVWGRFFFFSLQLTISYELDFFRNLVQCPKLVQDHCRYNYRENLVTPARIEFFGSKFILPIALLLQRE